MKWKFFCILIVLNLYLKTLALNPTDNPYEILGVKKSATVQEVRKAYKILAKEWHPDKSDDPSAANKFLAITQAYEVLTDPDRKNFYDNYGIINPEKGAQSTQDFPHFDEFDPFDDLFNVPHGYQFAKRTSDLSIFQKFAITRRTFENNYYSKSFTVPNLIFFFSDWCVTCLKLEPVLRRALDELEPIGVDVTTVNINQEPELSKKCGVNPPAPALALLIQGKVFLYRESVYSMQNIVQFVRSLLPYKLIQNVADENLNEFLGGWHDNRVRALVFQKKEPVRLRYLLMAFYYSERVVFGFVLLNSSFTDNIQSEYQVSSEFDTLLLFNEDPKRPIASLSMSIIPVQSMKNIIFENKYLILPRLSSQKVLDAICPVEWASRRKRLCVVLVSKNTREHDKPRQAMRQYAQESNYKSDRVRFTYIYQEKQEEFVNALLVGKPDETTLNVVILWRRDVNHIKYEWVQGSWSSEKGSLVFNRTKLESTLSKLLKTDETFTYEAVVKELIDEHAQGLMYKIVNKFLIMLDVFKDNLTIYHLLAAVAAVFGVILVIVIGYFIAYLVEKEEKQVQSLQLHSRYVRMRSEHRRNVRRRPELKLHELRGETYNGMVRLLKPGCRTIVLLLDRESLPSLLPEFHAIVWPYRKNKSLMFGYMFLERGLEWYKRLLNLTLSKPRDLPINPRNCVGTVLSINGHRRHFCMYHIKIAENYIRSQRSRTSRSHHDEGSTFRRIGNVMGLADSSDSNTDDIEQGTRKVVKSRKSKLVHGSNSNGGTVAVRTNSTTGTDRKTIRKSNLLSALPDWLESLFEGTTHRYYINYWPDFPTK